MSNNMPQNLFSSGSDTTELEKIGIPAFTTFEVFPRFTKVNAGTTSNVEVNFDAMFSGTNQWDKNKDYATNVYVTKRDKENSINSKIYKSLKYVPTSIDIDNGEYWQDKTSTYFEIQNNKAYHKYINEIPSCYTHAICIRSTFDPEHQNVIVNWGDNVSVALSNAIELNDAFEQAGLTTEVDQQLSNVLGRYSNGSYDVIYEKPKVQVKKTGTASNPYGKNSSYTYYCYHDYMPAMVSANIVEIKNDNGTITAKQNLADQPYRVLIYGTTFYSIGKHGGVDIKYYLDPLVDYDIDIKKFKTDGERSYKNNAFNHILLSRIFDPDLPFFPDTAITLASLASSAKNLLYINIPKYFDAFNNVINTYEIFKNCTNLQYCNGFNNKMRFKSLRGMCGMFSGCKNLLKCDIKIAKNVIDHNIASANDGNRLIFYNCSNLAVDLLSLLPLDGFSARYMNLVQTFSGCKSLDTTLDNAEIIKQILWKDTTKIWKACGNNNDSQAAFYGCNQLNNITLINTQGDEVQFIPDGWKNNEKYIDPDLKTNIPEITTISFEFNGNEQSIDIPKNERYTVEGILSATDAGEYTVTLKLKEGYIWSNGSLKDQEIKWSITKAKNKWENNPELSKTEWREDEDAGEVINIGTSKFGNVKVTLDGEEYDINNPLPTESDKQYELKFIVDETANYEGLTYTITFEIIDRPDIAEPDIADKTYTGNPYYIITVNNTFTVEGVVLATDVGNYSCTITPNDGYEWPDNTADSKTFTWKITQATNTWTTNPSISKSSWYENDIEPGVLTEGVAKFGNVKVKLNNEDYDIDNPLPTEPGTYKIEFIVEEDDNYTGLSETISFEILQYGSQITINDIMSSLDLNYTEVVPNLGEDEDEVAILFKDSTVDNIRWTIPETIVNVEFLAVAGGGGGGGSAPFKEQNKNINRGGAGGGGGGVVTGYINILPKDSVLTIKVGAGGAGGQVSKVLDAGTGAAVQGGSTILYVDDTFYLSACGGGGDLGRGMQGGIGGSNAGSRTTSRSKDLTWKNTAINTSVITNGETYGHLGGIASNAPDAGGRAGGGGGGAMEDGGNSIKNKGTVDTATTDVYGGKGGEGLSSDITGTMTIYGSGGGGGSGWAGYGGAGGTGAGTGGVPNEDLTGSRNGTNAVANQGGGGGGGGSGRDGATDNTVGNGGNGGSGIFVLRFKVNKSTESSK